MTFKEKLVGIFTSIRFWQLVLIGGLEALVQIGAIDGTTIESIVRVIELVLGGSLTIGTLDSVAIKLGTSISTKK